MIIQEFLYLYDLSRYYLQVAEYMLYLHSMDAYHIRVYFMQYK